MIKGKQHGKGLKPGLNMADTGSVVDTVKGYAKTGRGAGAYSTAAGNPKNNMTAANASKK